MISNYNCINVTLLKKVTEPLRPQPQVGSGAGFSWPKCRVHPDIQYFVKYSFSNE